MIIKLLRYFPLNKILQLVDFLWYCYPYISAEELAVAEDPEEVCNEEGAEHEDGWEQSRVRVRLVTLRLRFQLQT